MIQKRVPVFLLLLLPGFILAQFPGGYGRPVPEVTPEKYLNEAERIRVKEEGVKTMLRFGYLSENKEAEALRGRVVYNLQGNVELEELQDFEGNPARTIEIEWFKGGLKMKSFRTTTYGNGGAEQAMFFWAFTEEGLLAEYSYSGQEYEDFSEQYAYNDMGKLLVKRTFAMDDTPGPYERFIYDEAGRLSRIEKFDFGDIPRGSVAFEYDGEQLRTEIHYGPGMNPVKTYDYQYGEDGRLVLKTMSVAGGILAQKETWKYNSRGDTLEHTLFIEGDEAPTRDVYEVNARGQRTSFKSYDPDGSLFTWYSYTWDSTGNGAGWIRHTPDGGVDSRLKERFDPTGRILERTVFRSGDRTDTRELFKYDERKRPLEHKIFKFGKEWALYWFVFESH